MQDYFAFLQIEKKYDINLTELETSIKRKRRELLKTDEIEATAYLNRIAKCLRDEYQRAEYLLMQAQINVKEMTITDQKFLMEQMQIREEMDELHTQESITNFSNKLDEKISQSKTMFATNYASEQQQDALSQFVCWAFYLAQKKELKKMIAKKGTE